MMTLPLADCRAGSFSRTNFRHCRFARVGSAGESGVESELAAWQSAVIHPVGAIDAPVGSGLERVTAADLVNGSSDSVDFGESARTGGWS